MSTGIGMRGRAASIEFYSEKAPIYGGAKAQEKQLESLLY